MPTVLVGTAYKIEDMILGQNDTITAGTQLTAVDFRTEDPDSSDTVVTSRSVIFEGTVNEFELSQAEDIQFFANNVEIANSSPTYEFVSLATNVGTVFGITFSAGGDTYFLPSNNSPSDGLQSVTADSVIRASGGSFRPLDFGLEPAGATEYAGQVVSTDGTLVEIESVYDTDDTPGNPHDGFEGQFRTAINNDKVTVTVELDTGATITGVNALLQGGFGNFGIDTRTYALEIETLEEAGFTLGNVIGVSFEDAADHDLTYADIGFEAIGTVADVDTTPVTPPAPQLNEIDGNNSGNALNGTAAADLINGQNGNDRIIAGNGDDVIYGGGDDDRLWGQNGADSFVFGDAVRDNDRDFDRIEDFELGVDSIVLAEGASIRRTFERGEDFVIQLNGDRDHIRIENVDSSVLEDIQYFSGDFIA